MPILILIKPVWGILGLIKSRTPRTQYHNYSRLPLMATILHY